MNEAGEKWLPTGHPRPEFRREHWWSLDGEWNFVADKSDRGRSAGWSDGPPEGRRIRVPYCPEAAASGIGEENPGKILWYSRTFERPALADGKRLKLHFEAVDFEARVWLNGKLLGGHKGGYTPFSFDITSHLKEENLLVVQALDSRSASQPRGKQTFFKKPFAIWYTGVSGIWQSVWLEEVGAVAIARCEIDANPLDGKIAVRAILEGKGAATVSASASLTGPDGFPVSGAFRQTGATEIKDNGGRLRALELEGRVENPAPWSPENPALYELTVELTNGNSSAGDSPLDSATFTFGFRRVEADGLKILLNGEPLYQQLLLNQGYYPEGRHYTPTEEDIIRDLTAIKEMGFNGFRMHQKVEDRRLLHWADRIGLLVWEEMPSWYWWSEKAKENFEREWPEIYLRDRNHPCIIVWAPFNESWGVHKLLWEKSVVAFMKKTVAERRALDPTRLVVDNSGFMHTDTDIFDVHHYFPDAEDALLLYEKLKDPGAYKWTSELGRFAKKRALCPALFAPGCGYGGQPILISEYGGFGFYPGTGKKDLLEEYADHTLLIAEQPHICGYVYTQFADTQQERNGLLKEDRAPKNSFEEVRALNETAKRTYFDRLDGGGDFDDFDDPADYDDPA